MIAWSVKWRALFPHTGFREHQRVPLWHPDVPFVLITSQRAGSTLGTAWFFHHAGLLNEARSLDPFVHRYEQEVFLKTSGYFAGLEKAVTERPVVKLVRDPGARAFSSYLALHDRLATSDPKDHRAAIRRKIAQHTGKPYALDQRLSFRDFLSWAAAEDHKRMDGHEARQVNAYEDELPGGISHLVKLETVRKELPALETALGLPLSTDEAITDFATSQHHVPKCEATPELVDEIINEGIAIPRAGAQPKITTQTIADYPDVARDLAAAYGEDYKRYGYALPSGA